MENENTQIIDLSCYRWEGEWDWLKEAQSTEAGRKRIMAQIDCLEEMMRGMKIGDEFSIINICSNPKYYSVAVKIVCIIILSWRSLYRKEQREYEFNNTYTKVRRII